VHGGHHRLQVRPGRHLGHDATEPGVFVHRGRHLVGEQLHPTRVVEAHHADTRLVARGLDPQDDHALRSRRIVYASAPLGR
jgi:hypothetical protein